MAFVLCLAILLLSLYILKVNYQFSMYARAGATYSIMSFTAYSSIFVTFVLSVCKTLTQIEAVLTVTGLLWVAISLLALQTIMTFFIKPTYSTQLNAFITIRSFFVLIIACLYLINRSN